MSDNYSTDFVKKLDKRIAFLRASKETHITLLKEQFEVDTKNIFGMDFVVISIIHRSISLIDGFTTMVENRNPLCAAALCRMQLDSVMRLYACWLVDDPHKIWLSLLNGFPFNRIKTKDGISLTDKYLHEEVSKIYPWFSQVYKATSGFIHLSTPHLVAPIRSIDNSERTFHFSIGIDSRGGRKWQENEIDEAVEAFIETTKCLLQLCSSWVASKKKSQEINPL